MNTIGTALGCMLLIGALAAPVAFAHYDAGVDGAFGDADNDSNANRVSGWYVGAAGGLAAVNNVPAQDDSACAQLPDADLQALCEAILAGGDSAAGAVQSLCDMEVNFPGGLDNDEAFVDGSSAGPGTLADNVNDGGSGSVCHTPEGFYDAVEGGAYDYDTGGCSYASASGDDMASDVLWGSPSCDDETPGSNGGLINHVLTLSLCTVNSVLSSDPVGDAEGLVTAEAECLDNFVECANEVLNDVTGGQVPAVDALGNSLETATDDLLNSLSGDSPATECPTGATSCGADSSADRSTFGDLGSGAVDDGVAGVPFPATSPCDAFGSASVFLWNAVVVDAGGDADVGFVTVGWVN